MLDEGWTHHQRLAASPSRKPAPPAFQILSLKSQIPGEVRDLLASEIALNLGSGVASSNARTKAEEWMEAIVSAFVAEPRRWT